MGSMTRRGRRRGGRLPAVPTASVAVMAGLLLVASGCTGDTPGGPPPSDEPVALRVTIATCAGSPTTQQGSDIETGVGDVLSSYVVAGFLGDYPREDFVPSLDAFTAGAARDAAADIDLLTAARFADAEAVRATGLAARISCLVDGDDIVGASAKVAFRFEVDHGGTVQAFRLDGRFLLGQEDGTWSIFGYDVTRDDAVATRSTP
jgi:hypothetical protein